MDTNLDNDPFEILNQYTQLRKYYKMVEEIKNKTFDEFYSNPKLQQRTTHKTSTLDGVPADPQSMDKTPNQIPVKKLSCTKCDWETGKLKQSKARQRMKGRMHAKHKDTNLPPGSTPSSSPLSFPPTIPSPPPSIPTQFLHLL